MKPEEVFLDFLSRNYESVKDKLKRYCINQKITFDEDVFGDTIIKIHDIIATKGLQDLTDDGINNYIFISFKRNIAREKQYARIANRSELEDLSKAYDHYYNSENEPETVKLFHDLKEDYSILYIMKKVEEHFDDEHIWCFRVKYLYKLTYNELYKKASTIGIKNSRQKVVDVMKWCREHIKKEDVDKSFEEFLRQDYY